MFILLSDVKSVFLGSGVSCVMVFLNLFCLRECWIVLSLWVMSGLWCFLKILEVVVSVLFRLIFVVVMFVINC